MINLLPPKEKEALLIEQTKKLVRILGMTVLFALTCLVFVLLSIYFFASGEADSQSFSLEQATKEYQSPDATTYKTIIQKYNKTLPQVHSFYSGQTSFSDALDTIYALSKPDGVSFLNISLDILKAGSKKDISVSIVGTSDTRDNLISYQNSLATESAIKNVSFSPESWINSANINFNVTFNLAGK